MGDIFKVIRYKVNGAERSATFMWEILANT